MKKLKDILVCLLILALALAVSYFFGRRDGWRAAEEGIHGEAKRDTLYVHDTTFIESPAEKEAVPKGYELVPAGTLDRMTSQIIALEDSLEANPKVIVKDSTVYVEIPMEQKHYGDSTYDAWVSGYKPALDSLRIYGTTKVVTVTRTVTEKPWIAWGPSISVIVTPDGKLAPGIGGSVVLNLDRLRR